MLQPVTWRFWPGLQTEVDPAKIGEAARVFQNLQTGAEGAAAETRPGWESVVAVPLDAGWVYHAPYGALNGIVIAATRSDDGRVDNGLYYSPDKPLIVETEVQFESVPSVNPALWAENLDEIWTMDVEAQSFARVAGTAPGNDFDACRGCLAHPNGKTVYLFNAELEVKTLTAAGWSAALTLDAGQYYFLALLESGLVATIHVKGYMDIWVVLIDVSGAAPVIDSTIDLTALVQSTFISTLTAIGDDLLLVASDIINSAMRISLTGGVATAVWQVPFRQEIYDEFGTAYEWTDPITSYDFRVGGATLPRYGASPPALGRSGKMAVVVTVSEAFGLEDEVYFLVVFDTADGAILSLTALPSGAHQGGEDLPFWQVAAMEGRWIVWDGVDAVLVYRENGTFETWWHPFDVATHTATGEEIAPQTEDDWYDVGESPTSDIFGFAYAAALFSVPATGRVHLLEWWGALKGHTGRWLSWALDGTDEEDVTLTDAPVFNSPSASLDNTSDPMHENYPVAGNLALGSSVQGTPGTGFPPG